jgi:hypothetical protein
MTVPPVMAGLVPAIHVWSSAMKDMDGRHKAGHDDGYRIFALRFLRRCVLHLMHLQPFGSRKSSKYSSP